MVKGRRPRPLTLTLALTLTLSTLHACHPELARAPPQALRHLPALNLVQVLRGRWGLPSPRLRVNHVSKRVLILPERPKSDGPARTQTQISSATSHALRNLPALDSTQVPTALAPFLPAGAPLSAPYKLASCIWASS